MSDVVAMEVSCKGDGWREDFTKTVLMPSLLPVGSVVYPVESPLAWEVDYFTIESYFWSESEKHIRCNCKTLDFGDDSKEDTVVGMNSIGWSVMGRQPRDFERHAGPGQRRFLWRTLNGEFEVYGLGLHHIATCETAELAAMVADALESAADSPLPHEEQT